jgi:hypothetical protein
MLRHIMKSEMSVRALNRALLARQLLLRRRRLSVPRALEHLVGLQAQLPDNPYLGLWTRLEGFRPEALAAMVERRRAVRLALMRSTIHLVTARDCLALRPVLAPALLRTFYGNTTYGRGTAGMDLAALLAAGRALVEEQPRTNAELGALLRARWPKRDAASLGYAIRAHLPLVQVPPRGVWGKGGQARCTTAEAWLGRPLSGDDSPDATVLRYLAAYGPASARDAQAWSGLPALAEVFERLRPRLKSFRDERGQELLDLPRAPRPAAGQPAPPRFLPDYDNVLLAHADRARILPAERRARIDAGNGLYPTLLLDGFVAGTWKAARARSAAVLSVTLFERPRAPDRAALIEEGERLLRFLSPDAAAHRIELRR